MPKSSGAVTATVSSVTSLSESVKQILLKVDCPISFKPGQWYFFSEKQFFKIIEFLTKLEYFRVDAHIPGIKEIGGFSIVSAPHEYESSNFIKLAIKNTDHPPGRYFHTKVCQ